MEARGAPAKPWRRSATGWEPGTVPEKPAMPPYETGDVRLRYEMVGSGFPLLATPGGG
jgi:hypothetical protein